MQRTTVVLPQPLKQMAIDCARSLRISFGEFVRRAVENEIRQSARSGKKGDPFRNDRAVFRGPVPKDLSARHDLYLYGEE